MASFQKPETAEEAAYTKKVSATSTSIFQSKPFVTASELAQMNFPEADFLINDILPRTYACWPGHPKLEKFFVPILHQADNKFGTKSLLFFLRR